MKEGKFSILSAGRTCGSLRDGLGLSTSGCMGSLVHGVQGFLPALHGLQTRWFCPPGRDSVHLPAQRETDFPRPAEAMGQCLGTEAYRAGHFCPRTATPLPDTPMSPMQEENLCERKMGSGWETS